MSPLYKRVSDRHDHASCAAIRDVLTLVGDKWSVLLVATLAKHTHRFSDIRRWIPDISQRMLTRTLRSLERDGLVKRRVEATEPPSVYYSLTPLGTTLIEPLTALADWAKSNYPLIEDARTQFGKRDPDA